MYREEVPGKFVELGRLKSQILTFEILVKCYYVFHSHFPSGL